MPQPSAYRLAGLPNSCLTPLTRTSLWRKQKLGKSGGFTLVEMLIVVAIIAILIAVSIPLISSALEKARHAVDEANWRDAIALGTVFYLTESGDEEAYKKAVTDNNGDWNNGEPKFGYEVGANSQGKLGKPAAGVDGQCTKSDPSCTKAISTTNTRQPGAANGSHLELTIGKDGTITPNWASGASNPSAD